MQLKWPMRWDLFSLFPAYAGVIPFSAKSAKKRVTFPRIRGGDPEREGVPTGHTLFSPHTRG